MGAGLVTAGLGSRRAGRRHERLRAGVEPGCASRHAKRAPNRCRRAPGAHGTPEHPRDHRRPAALRRSGSAAAGRAGAAPRTCAAAQGAVSFERHYTASNDCTPARAALLTGLYTHQTGCMITGASTLDPGFPDVGDDAARTGLRHLLVRQVAPHPRRQPLDAATAGSAVLERYGFAGGTYPSPDGAPGQGWRVDPHIAGQFEQWFADERRREPWCTTVSSSTRTTSPGGTLERSRARRGQAPACAPAAPQLRDAGTCSTSPQATPAALATGDLRRVVRAGALHGPEARGRVAAASSTSTSSCSARWTVTSAGCCDTLASRPRWPRTRSSCSPPTTASTAPRTACAARAPPPTRRRSACRCSSRTRADAHQRARAAPHAADLERGRGAAAADDRHRLGSVARDGHYAHIARRLDLAASSPTPRRPAGPTCCTRPTRS